MYQRLVKKRFAGLVLSRPNRWHYYIFTNTVDSQFFFMSQTLFALLLRPMCANSVFFAYFGDRSCEC